jgi:hypothetical protein
LTLFFHPGRIKRGVAPQVELGPPLREGQRFRLTIGGGAGDDASAIELAEPFVKDIRALPADRVPPDPATWRMSAPGGGREPLALEFPEPLDHALLGRLIEVRDGMDVPVAGSTAIAAGETRWTFTPDEPWRAGRYEVLALSILEDSAGNQIGRAFEIDNFDTVDKGPDASTTLIPFTVLRSTSE